MFRAYGNRILNLREVKIVDTIFDEIAATFACGKRIELRGFGTFSVKVWKARTCRNPRTGAPIPIPKKAFPDSRRGRK